MVSESTRNAAQRRVGILFSGGPAPGANAVIGAAVSAFRRGGYEVIGFLNGYSGLMRPLGDGPLKPGEHYRIFEDRDLWGLRNSRGIVIGTARSNPGKGIRQRADLDDAARTAPLRTVYERLVELNIDALVSIGGDDTLKTANFLYEFQQRLAPAQKRVRIVHVPKTIDNDYRGIDFTFGFFTAVDVMAQELQNLRADAMATRSYFIAETMGRKAGWLAYGVAVAGEAHLVVGVEDVIDDLAIAEAVVDPATGLSREENRLNLDALTERIVNLITTREKRGKHYGTVVLAEGLAELLPESFIKGLSRDEHGHISLGKLDIGKLVASRVAQRYEERTGRQKKLTGVQLGYESRCSAPHAFDVLLGSQLGIGAYRAIAEENVDGHMVSVTGQLDLRYVPFQELIDPATLVTEVRFIRLGSDFHRLAHDLETRIERE